MFSSTQFLTELLVPFIQNTTAPVCTTSHYIRSVLENIARLCQLAWNYLITTDFLRRMKSLVVLMCIGYVLMSPAHAFNRRDWTKLLLTHHWPQTFCSMEHCKANFSYWTLHGMWPDAGSGCNSSWHFNSSLIEDLMPEMKKYWPDLIKPASTEFWKHEWVKHGTCAATVESLNNEHKYFSKALELYHKLDLESVLQNSQIIPSEEPYKLANLEDSLSTHYGTTPKIQCLPPTKGNEYQTLGQIEICFDKQFQLVDCEKTHNNEVLPLNFIRSTGFSVCHPSVPVYYPPPTGF